MSVQDSNEFSPEFERLLYTFELNDSNGKTRDQLELAKSEGLKGRYLFRVQANDQDCSAEFGSVCRYELINFGGSPQIGSEPEAHNSQDLFKVDKNGRVWMQMDRQDSRSDSQSFSFQVIAYDCGGKKSQLPATVQVQVSKEPKCRPALKGK